MSLPETIYEDIKNFISEFLNAIIIIGIIYIVVVLAASGAYFEAGYVVRAWLLAIIGLSGPLAIIISLFAIIIKGNTIDYRNLLIFIVIVLLLVFGLVCDSLPIMFKELS